MDLAINIKESIFIEDLLDEYVELVNDSIEQVKEQMDKQDEDSEHYIRNLQYTFEYEEKINKAKKIKNKIHKHCTKVFATPEWQANLR